VLCGASVNGRRIQRRVADLRWWYRLLGLGFIEEGGLARPALIGESGELFDLRLADEILFLLFYAWGMLSDMS
jgi:hypothetical protein